MSHHAHRPLLLVFFLLSVGGCTQSEPDPSPEPTDVPTQVPTPSEAASITPPPVPVPTSDTVLPVSASQAQVAPTGVQVETLQVKQAQPATKKEPRKRKTKRWLGLAVANMKEPIPGAPSTARAMIQRAHRGGPGHKAGLQRGDVIIEAGGHDVGPYQDYIEQARLKEIGDHLPLKVLRDGKPIVVNVPLIEKPANGKVWRRQHFPGSEAFSWTLPGVRPQEQMSDRKKSSKPQLLYFWASWCGPCRQTSPLVNQLHRDAADRLEVIAVSSEERKVIEEFLKKGGTEYAVAHDAEGLVKLDYEVQSLPTIVWLTGDRVTDWDYGIGGVRRVVQKLRRELEI